MLDSVSGEVPKLDPTYSPFHICLVLKLKRTSNKTLPTEIYWSATIARGKSAAIIIDKLLEMNKFWIWKKKWSIYVTSVHCGIDSISFPSSTENRWSFFFQAKFFFPFKFLFYVDSTPNMGLELSSEIKSHMLYQMSQSGAPQAKKFWGSWYEKVNTDFIILT